MGGSMLGLRVTFCYGLVPDMSLCCEAHPKGVYSNTRNGHSVHCNYGRGPVLWNEHVDLHV